MRVINIEKNPVHQLLFYSKRNIFFYNNHILNKFRFTYYCLKFKKQFRYLLWEKIRRHKIESYYHPNNLEHILMSINEEDEQEFNHVLDQW